MGITLDLMPEKNFSQMNKLVSLSLKSNVHAWGGWSCEKEYY